MVPPSFTGCPLAVADIDRHGYTITLGSDIPMEEETTDDGTPRSR
jgi:hypothetical protein